MRVNYRLAKCYNCHRLQAEKLPERGGAQKHNLV
jgi:hypothetical protein